MANVASAYWKYYFRYSTISVIQYLPTDVLHSSILINKKSNYSRYILYFLVWPFLLTHTHTHTHTRQDSSRQVMSWSQRPLPDVCWHSIHKRQVSTRPAGFKPAIPASEWSQIHPLDRAATTHCLVRYHSSTNFHYTSFFRREQVWWMLTLKRFRPKWSWSNRYSHSFVWR